MTAAENKNGQEKYRQTGAYHAVPESVTEMDVIGALLIEGAYPDSKNAQEDLDAVIDKYVQSFSDKGD